MKNFTLPVLLLSTFYNADAQRVTAPIELLVGLRFVRGINPHADYLIGLGKDFKVPRGLLMPSIRFSGRSLERWALMVGFDYTYTKKFVADSPYLYGSVNFVVQSSRRKETADYGFFTGQFGVGYPITSSSKIEAGFGVNRSDNIFWETRLRRAINVKYRKRHRKQRCAPLE